MIEPKAPCLGCKNRTVGCHSGCTIYSQYLTDHKNYVAWLKKIRQPDYAATDVEIRRFEKYRKQKVRKDKAKGNPF